MDYLGTDLVVSDAFFITFYNLCLGLARELFKYSRTLHTLQLLDDLFIILSLE
jgi:hypothetical protein